MNMSTIVIGVLLFALIVALTFLTNPPSSWVRTKEDEAKKRRHD